MINSLQSFFINDGAVFEQPIKIFSGRDYTDQMFRETEMSLSGTRRKAAQEQLCRALR